MRRMLVYILVGCASCVAASLILQTTDASATFTVIVSVTIGLASMLLAAAVSDYLRARRPAPEDRP